MWYRKKFMFPPFMTLQTRVTVYKQVIYLVGHKKKMNTYQNHNQIANGCAISAVDRWHVWIGVWDIASNDIYFPQLPGWWSRRDDVQSFRRFLRRCSNFCQLSASVVIWNDKFTPLVHGINKLFTFVIICVMFTEEKLCPQNAWNIVWCFDKWHLRCFKHLIIKCG